MDTLVSVTHCSIYTVNVTNAPQNFYHAITKLHKCKARPYFLAVFAVTRTFAIFLAVILTSAPTSPVVA